MARTLEAAQSTAEPRPVPEVADFWKEPSDHIPGNTSMLNGNSLSANREGNDCEALDQHDERAEVFNGNERIFGNVTAIGAEINIGTASFQKPFVPPVTTKSFPKILSSELNPVSIFDSPGEKKLAQTPPFRSRRLSADVDHDSGSRPHEQFKGDYDVSESLRSLPGLTETVEDSHESGRTFDLMDFGGVFTRYPEEIVTTDGGDDIGALRPLKYALTMKESLTPPSSLHASSTDAVVYSGMAQAMDGYPSHGDKRNSPPLEPFSMTSSAQSSFTQSTGMGTSVLTPPAHIQHSGGNHRGPPTVLYSAIGSLENMSGNLSSFNNRYLKQKPVGRDFTGPGGTDPSTLIPPANQNLRKNHVNHPNALATVLSNLTSVKVRTSEVKTDDKIDVDTSAQAATKSKPSRRNKKPNSGILKNSVTEDRNSKPDRLSPADKPSSGKKRDKPRKKGKTVNFDGKVEEAPVELFRPSCDAYTPRMEKKDIKYKPAEMRTPVQKMSSPMGTLSRPNFRDALRRVAMILRQHIVKIERRFENPEAINSGLFSVDMKEAFCEENFLTPRYKCTMVRVPTARPSTVYGLRRIRTKFAIPSEEEIYEFGHQLFNKVQLSSECSIVCLIYVERLMEAAKVPLLASTWRPIFMCGLLLASKVWQDLASWNVEFAGVYPQFSRDAINRLELEFLRDVKWDLYISSSLYAKYYFALRALVEKQDFRQRYNRMVGGVGSVAASEALKIQKRTELVKEEALLQLSRSM